MRKHIKMGHKLSPRHKYIRADSANNEIPRKLKQLKELKVWTANVHQRELCVLRRTTTQGGQEQRCPSERRTKKAPKGWRRRSCGGGSGGLGASGAREAHYTTRVTDDGYGGFDVLHGAPPERGRDRTRDAKRRQAQKLLGRKTPELERGSPHICFFNAMLKATERTLLAKIRDLSPSDRQGTQGDYRRREVLRAEREDKILRTSPNVRQAWTGTQNADHLRDGRVHHVQMEEAGSRPRVPVLRTAGRGLGHSRWIPKKEGCRFRAWSGMR